MPEEISAPPKPRNNWLRRAFYLVLGLVVVLILVHRPLFHWAAPWVIRHWAKREHLVVDLKTRGSIWTNLSITQIHVVPDGTGPTPVEELRIGELRFQYSLWKLWREGVGEFITRYDARDAELQFIALPSASAEERRQKISIAQQLNRILAQPAVYSDRAIIERFRVRVRSPEGETIVGPVHLSLFPDQPGELRIGRLQIPGIPVWENLQATTTYQGRNLVIEDLALAPELIIRELRFDASRRREKVGGLVTLTAEVFGGELGLELTGRELPKPGTNLEKGYATELRLRGVEIDLPALAEYFGMVHQPIGQIERVDLDFAGEPERPQTWAATFSAEAGLAKSIGLLADQVVAVQGTIEQGRGSASGRVVLGENTATADLAVILPENVNAFHRTGFDAVIELNAPRLAQIGERFNPPQPWRGAAWLKSQIALKDERLTAVGDLTLDAAQMGKWAAERVRLGFSGSRPVQTDPSSPLVGLKGTLQGEGKSLALGTFQVDSARLDLSSDAANLAIRALELRRAENVLSLQGDLQIPRAAKDWPKTPGALSFSIDLPNLAAFGLRSGERLLEGNLTGRGEVKNVQGERRGTLTLNGNDLKFGEAKLPKLDAKIELAGENARLEKLTAVLDSRNQVTISGDITTAEPFHYEADLRARLPDLEALRELLLVVKTPLKLSGALELDWKAAGALSPQTHSGDVTLRGSGLTVGQVALRTLRIAGDYAPQRFASREIFLASGPAVLSAKASWQNGLLNIPELSVRQGEKTALRGSLTMPFELGRETSPIQADTPFEANLTATQLDLVPWLTSFGKIPPLSALIDATLSASGTVQAPIADLKLSARQIRPNPTPAGMAKLEPAEVLLNVHFAKNLLELSGQARHPLIQPLNLQGRIPLVLADTLKSRRLDPNTPWEGTIKLPASSLAFLPRFVPAVRRMDGTAAIDLQVAGTLAKPVLRGQTALRIKSARLTAATFPTIDDFVAEATFADDLVKVRRVRGTFGGGTLSLGGQVQLVNLREPIFDLQLKAKEVLVKRDESLNLRADADLRLTGPLPRAHAAGTIWVTQSRFFREIDIIPIGLPGRPKRVPRRVGGPPVVSFPNPPLRDWTFDIAIKTRAEDPFLIRGNLANGALGLDLQFGGTGLQPWLNGAARVEQFNAALPFSKLSITQGFVYFKKEEPFRPVLELQAESKVRDYLVRAYIHGPTTAPAVEFTSEPPLGHADIVSLLATGMTAGELSQGGDVLASRAAILAVQTLYRKVFKKEQLRTPPPTEVVGQDPFLNRFQVELGAIDNRSGGQEISAQYRINENTYIVGELDVLGRYSGALKYLIRFR